MIDIKVINTIAIGENSLNHAVFKREKDHLKLLNYSFFEFDTNDMDRFKLIAKDLKSYADKDLFTYITFTTRDTIKEIFPIRGNPKDFKLEVIEHLKATYMVDLVDFNFDYAIFHIDDIHVCYAGMIPKKISEVIFRDLSKEGFKIISAETDCDSYKRGILKLTRENHFMQLHIRLYDSVFMIFKNGVLMLERQIINGLADLVENLSIQKGVTPEEAEDIILNVGFDNTKVSEEDIPVITSVIDRLSMQVQRTLDLYFQTYRGEPPTVMLVTGYGYKIPEFDRYLAELFAMPVYKETFAKLMETDIEIDLKKLHLLDAMICAGLEE